jgi:hypothetical protein
MCAVYTDVERSLSSQPSSEFRIGFRLIAHNHAAIRVYDAGGNMIETHEHAGEFKKW